MVRSLALFAGAIATVAAAQATTVNFFLPGFDKQALVGSVVAVKGEATTVAISCPDGTDASECGIQETRTVVGGASTMDISYSYSPPEEYGGGYMDNRTGCKLDPKKDVAICSAEATNVISGSTESMAATTALSGYKQLIMPITITAGAEKLNGDAATATASATGSEATTADKPKDTAAQSTGSATTSGADADATPSPVESDNAAGPMVTQNAILAVAAIVGGAAMLL
ncbi:hypothetical protein NXS19_013547 [Fusarium pseudograminearum]|uniref:Uncharacterized protein n=1 Tax=Fusarium pseudograminearum (strain CS3096) TaxID=1028729 RepID=K3W0D7_FUSPC|nr:hypothetical protein FPSE_05931 [Fusarium pseudograminearum CS3096]EKJ73970.1 hypothetical protein FPSE_05931 [Fusarium pseudograminearum CS3096]KAF0636351.1 hypothetical protein FPSE5266_05931 [Fusarium pseudograminearum]UZP45735.1 hypothetical protein NXS19_013547 [Fusarium pseudograminearum]